MCVCINCLIVGQREAQRLKLQISKSIDLKKKEVEDVLGGPESWKGAPKSDGRVGTLCVQSWPPVILLVHSAKNGHALGAAALW